MTLIMGGAGPKPVGRVGVGEREEKRKAGQDPASSGLSLTGQQALPWGRQDFTLNPI